MVDQPKQSLLPLLQFKLPNRTQIHAKVFLERKCLFVIRRRVRS